MLNLKKLKDLIFESDNGACFIERDRILKRLESEIADYDGWDKYALILSKLLRKVSTPILDCDYFAGRVVEGFETERVSFIYNYFVLCGPSADPAGVEAAASVLDAFAAIAEGKHAFISRGDASGTHTKELALWPEELGITKEAESFASYTDWYISANTGMGACLVMAEEMGAYILTDKATFLTFQANDGVI